MKKAILTDVKWTNPDGTPTQYFSELIQSLSQNSMTKAVSTTEPTNGQVLKYVSSTGLWTPGTDAT
jgi:hypothetical protein